MLVKPGEVFSVETVVEKALRQDVGPDASLAENIIDYKYTTDDPPMGALWEYKKKYRDKNPDMIPDAYAYDYKMIERKERYYE